MSEQFHHLLHYTLIIVEDSAIIREVLSEAHRHAGEDRRCSAQMSGLPEHISYQQKATASNISRLRGYNSFLLGSEENIS
jgi:hypothetical protein